MPLPEIIRLAAMLHAGFPDALRMVEDLPEGGVDRTG